MICRHCYREPQDGEAHGFLVCDRDQASTGRGGDVTWPGGRTFENLGPEPMTFYSPAEQKRYMKQHGIEEFVRHQPVPGSDTSPHTTRWVSVPDMAAATKMLERIAQGKGHDAEGGTWVQEWVPSTEVGVTRVRGRL